MKHSIVRKLGEILLITGVTLAVPVYAEEQGGPGMTGGDGKSGMMGAPAGK